MSPKILIIGATGLIGRALVEEINIKYVWKGTCYTRKIHGYLKCDIMDPESVQSVFDRVKPTHVIHCAQLAGGLDFCEKNPDLSERFHRRATINIGEQCLKYKTKFIFISTECVFDGKKECYDEDAEINPLSIYGRHKAESEIWMRHNLKDYIIIRAMSVYGWDPLTKTPNALMKLYFSLLKGEKIFVPTFRWGMPTYVKELSKAITELCLSGHTGIFHVAGTTFISRYEWLKNICQALGWDISFLVPQDSPFANDSLRPLRIRFNSEKFRNTFSSKLHTLKESLSLLKQDIEKENNDFLSAKLKNDR